MSFVASVAILSCVLGPFEKQVEEIKSFQKTSLVEGRQFLESVIQEINSQYGLNIGLADACRLVKQHIDRLEVPAEMRDDLLALADLFESGTFSVSLGNQREARSLKYRFYWPWEWNFFGLNERHHTKHKPAMKKTTEQEFILPDKLAAGFVCALAGSLLCVVPGGQGVGLTLVGTGLALAIDGMATGESPYYLNPTTNEKTPLPYQP